MVVSIRAVEVALASRLPDRFAELIAAWRPAELVLVWAVGSTDRQIAAS